MAKAKEAELSIEEQDEFDKLVKKDDEAVVYNRLPTLAINTATVDEEGNDIPVQTFTIMGEKGLYSKAVQFQPIKFINKLMAMQQDAKGVWKCTNESIFFNLGQEPIDAAGGVGCGRVLGKAAGNFNEEQKKANRAKAQFYGFLFGLVTFPGQEPRLVSLRLGAGKSITVSNVFKELKNLNIPTREALLTLKLIPNKDRKNIHPDLEVTFDANKKADITPAYKKAYVEVDKFIESSNKRVHDSHMQVLKLRSGNASSAKLVQQVLDNSDDNLDDEIPF